MENSEPTAIGCTGCILYPIHQDEILSKDEVLMSRITKHYCNRCMAFVGNKPIMTKKRLILEREK